MSAPERYFEDYPVGAVFTGGPLAVSEADILDFARRYDPQPMHVDKAAAEAGPFGGLIASGWHTGALMMQLFVAHFLSPASSLASPGLDELRWLKPVRPGDTLHVEYEVTEVRPSRSKPDRGIVRFTYRYINQAGDAVLSMSAMQLLRRRPA
jgi:acyl dehydratase